jgi:hypothetical protein
VIVSRRYEFKEKVYVRIIRQEHHNPINTHAPATCRRKAILEGLAEYLINELCLIISLVLLVCLLLLRNVST